MAKQEQIELVANGKPRSFDFEHALRILVLEKSKGKINWKIADSKKYEFKDNEIIRRKVSGDSEESK